MSNWKQLDLSALSLLELKQLQQRLGREIAKRQEDGRKWLSEHGRGLVEKGGPIYRNPHNSAETWSGRGKRPDWVTEALEAGLSLQDLTKDIGVTDDFLPVQAAKSKA